MGLREFTAKALFGSAISQAVNQQVAENMASLVNQNLYHLIGKDMPIMTHEHTDYVQKGGLSVGAVYEVVDLIMKKVIASPPIIYEVKSQSKLKKYENLMKSDSPIHKALAMSMKSEAIEEVSVPAISKILDQPNEKQSWDEFLGLIVLLYLYDGNALMYGNGANVNARKWSEVWSLPFNSQQFAMRSGGVFDPVRSYYVQPNGGDILLDFPAEQIEHIKTINPTWDNNGAWLYGVSPLRAYLGNMLRAKLGDDAANKMLNNEGAFGVLSPKNPDDVLTDAQKRAFHERLTEAQRSKDKMARIFPGSVALEWLQIGLPATDLQLLEMIKLNREEFYRAYHVPVIFASTDAATYNNMGAANKQFIYNAVAPVCDAIGKALTRFICDPYRKDNKRYMIKLDYTSLPELSEDMKQVADAVDKMDWITDNEKREIGGWGRIDSPEYDVAYKSKSKAPIHQIFNGETVNEGRNQGNNGNNSGEDDGNR